MTGKSGLLIVDLQNDFCPGGALPAREGHRIIAPVNKLLAAFKERNLPIILTRDWHPNDHCSFRSEGGMWPPHCIQGTRGAEFHSHLVVPDDAIIISKAIRRDRDAYSGFQGTDLAERLRQLGVGDLFVGGLATDYCVKNTVLDALSLGFRVHILTDCMKGVNVKPTDSANAIRLMIKRGAKRITSQQLLKNLSRRVAVSSSS